MKRKDVDLSEEERPTKKIRHMENTEIYDINALPREIHQQISSHLDDRAKRQMRLANSTWFKVINYSDFCIWIPRNSMMDALVARLSRYTQPISLRFAKQPRRPITFDPKTIAKISKLTNLTSLLLDDDYGMADQDWMQLSTLTNLEYFKVDATFDKYSFKLLENFKKLRNLETYRLNYNFPELASLLEKLHHLESIKITAEAPDEVNLISKMNAEHLTSLEMNFMCNDVVFNVADVDKFSNLKRFSWRNDLDEPVVFPIYKLTQLESLECNLQGHVQHIHLFTNLTQLTLFGVDHQDTSPLVKLTNMKSLHISADNDLNFEFFSTMPHLEFLHVASRNSGEFLSIIPHESNLTKLMVLGYGSFDSRHLTRFSNLQLLTVGTGDLCPHLNETIKHLTQLKFADVAFWKRGQVIDEVDFSPLVQLETLNLSGTSHRAVSTLHGLTRLTSLVVKVEDKTDFKFLEHMPLQYLSLDCIDHTDSELWHILPNMTALASLKIILVEERDEELLGLSRLTNLTNLVITGRITGKHLTALTSLQHISMAKVKTQPVYTSFEQLAPYLPNLLQFDSVGTLSTWRGNSYYEL